MLRPSVVITGASRGIGAACAVRLAARGFRVLAGVRQPADGAALRAKVVGELTPLPLDVTDEASVRAAAEEVTRLVGDAGLAGLVNNAGIVIPGPLEIVPLDAVRRQFEVNVLGQLAVTQALLPLLRQARGRVVNVGSIGGRLATPFVGAYHASKAALAAMTDALRAELRPWGIEVVLVEPGNVATPIWGTSAATADELEGRVPAERLAQYKPALAAVRRHILKVAARATHPDAVARAVTHALTVRRPRTRYRVGWDAWVISWLAWLPDRLRDALLRRVLMGRTD